MPKDIGFERIEGFWYGMPDGGVAFHSIDPSAIRRAANPEYEPHSGTDMNAMMTDQQREDFTAFMQDPTAELDRNFGTVTIPDKLFPEVSDEMRDYMQQGLEDHLGD